MSAAWPPELVHAVPGLAIGLSSSPLRILHLEDDPGDADLVAGVLDQGGVDCELTRVQTREDFTRALGDDGFQLILADYSLPGFDGMSALRIALEMRPELPFIFVSGALGEEIATEAMKIGATDYVLKERLSRIVSAVPRALRECEARKERQRAEERLRRNEAFLADGQQISHTGTWGWQFDSGKVIWSDEQYRLLGFAPGGVEPSVERLLAAVHPDDLERVRRVLAAAKETRQPYAMDYRVLLPGGAIRHLHASGRPAASGATGALDEFIGTTTDVTERVEAAAALHGLYRDLAAREARIRRLVDSNIVGIFIWDFRGRILDANDAFLRMVGHDREELVSPGLRWTDLTPPQWRDVDERKAAQLKDSGCLQPYEKEYFRKDGSRVPALVGAATFDDARDQGVAFVLDLTERKCSEEAARTIERRYHDMQMRLADANRLASIGQLSAAIAHELNQPLAGIVANANTAVRRLDADPPNTRGARVAANRMVRDAHRAADVIKRLRALFGNKETATEWMDLNDAAREVLALSATALEQGRVALRCEFAQDLPLVKADRVQLQQVIMNLLRNASDAMSAVQDGARELVIRTDGDEKDRVRLTVRDTGVGIDPEIADKLFEAFYTTKSAGMGIGLSVSRSIIERHHGRLWAEPNQGPGASFSFELPVQGADARTP